jgi:hypothetical protein
VIAALKANESAKLKYEMLGALGKGKFSTVYRARCVDGSATMALKKVQVQYLNGIAGQHVQANECCLNGTPHLTVALALLPPLSI